MRFLTAGESHGPAEQTIIEGMPAGIPLTSERIDLSLSRRQIGYGRGGRMQIEKDHADILAGVRLGLTTGAPISISIENKDFANWKEAMSPEPFSPERAEAIAQKKITRLRPGHADYPGALKYRLADVRDVLERASARETAARVAAGAVAASLLECFGIEVTSHVLAIGGLEVDGNLPIYQCGMKEIKRAAEKNPLRCADPGATEKMKVLIDEAREKGDSLGGIVEVLSNSLPIGLGSHVHWDRRIDGLLAAALMSIPAVKGVEFGLGFASAALPGSSVHDAFEENFHRSTNRAGGVEGGMTNGQPLVVRLAMKPIPTMTTPISSIDLETGKISSAHVERSDVCAVPACGVVAEAMVAWVLAQALGEKLGGDSLAEMQERYEKK
ncbi:MAG TPA: chorismate synthase [Chroococcales cyanobacterium]